MYSVDEEAFAFERIPVRKSDSPFKYLSGAHKLSLTLATVCAIVHGSLLSGAFAFLVRRTLNALSMGDFDETKRLAFIFVGLGVLVFFLSAIQMGIFVRVADRNVKIVRAAFFDSVVKHKNVAWFDANDPDRLVADVERNSRALRESLTTVSKLVESLSCAASGLVVALRFSPEITLMMLAFTPFFMLFGKFISNVMRKGGDEEGDGDGIGETFGSVGAIRTTATLSLQPLRINQYTSVLRRRAQRDTQRGRYVGMGFGMFHLTFFCAYAAAFALGGRLILDSREREVRASPLNETLLEGGGAERRGTFSLPHLPTPFPTPAPSSRPTFAPLHACGIDREIPSQCTIDTTSTRFETEAAVCTCPPCACGCGATGKCLSGGDVMAVFFAIFLGCLSLGQAAQQSSFAEGREAAAFFYNAIDESSDISLDAERNTVELEKPRGDVEFKKVTFAYPIRPNAPVLNEVSFKIAAGTKVALVGRSGSGKSTVTALLLKYYTSKEGFITLDGIDVSKVRTRRLREMVGLVAQEPTMFNASVVRNVRMAAPNASDASVVKALKRANAYDFVMRSPKGLDSLATEFSGGQRQRIAIARTLIRKPLVLIFDEATAALDNESERIITDVVSELKQTVIIVAHRLSAIRPCSQIFVLEDGKIVERGSPDELIQIKEGRYAAMVAMSGVGATGGGSGGRASGGGAEKDDADSDDESRLMVSAPPAARHPTPPPPTGPKKSVLSLLGYIRNESFPLLVGVLAAVANGAAFPFFGYLLSHGIFSLFVVNDTVMTSETTKYAKYFAILAFVNGSTLVAEHWAFGYLSGRLTMRIRAVVFKHLLRQEYAWLIANKDSFPVHLNENAATVKSALLDRMQILITGVSSIASGSLIGFKGSWKMALATLAMFPFMVVAGVLETRVPTETNEAEIGALFSETVHGIRTVVALNMQSVVVEMYEEALERTTESNAMRGVWVGAGFALKEMMQYFMYAVSFYYGSHLISEGEIDMTKLMQGLTGILLTAIGLGEAIALAPDLMRGRKAFDTINDIVERRSDIDPLTTDGYVPDAFEGKIAFTDVSFEYVEARPVLRNLNLVIEPRKTTALIGESGSGKSTVIQLIQRLYDPTSGSITFDDLNAKSFNVQWLRMRIGYVSQEPTLFNTSIRDNVRLGKLDAAEHSIVEALRNAEALEFVSNLPNGLDTTCGSRGSQLSGGQRQRIAIARALVRNPSLFIFDEATSALDETTQANIQNTLERISEGKTTVVIAHRLSTIRNAHVVVEMADGRVVRSGTYAEIVES